MSKIAYIVFFMPCVQMAMQQTPVQTHKAKHIIAVANILKQGVTAHVDDAHNKVWIRKDTIGLLEVFPLVSPKLTHMLVVRDTDEKKVLAEHCFMHPDQTSTFMVDHHVENKDLVSVKRVTPDDLPQYGKQQPGSQEFAAMLQKQGQ